MQKAKAGFTLIELLVVVLIIGILAAVALPMYQKTVEKTRWAEAFSMIHAIKNAEALWILENGIPTETISFLGENATHSLAIDIPQTKGLKPTGVMTNHFWYVAACGTANCSITLYRNDTARSDNSKLYLFFWQRHDGSRYGGCFPEDSYPVGTEICDRFKKEFGI